MSGNHHGGGRRTDGPDWDADRSLPSGGYPAESGDYGYEPPGGGEYDPRSGEYRTVSGGGYPPGRDYGPPAPDRDPGATGGYGSGEYSTGGYGSGEYGTGGYSTGGSGSGGYSSGGYGSGEYSTGSGAYRSRESGGYSTGGSPSASGYGSRGAAYRPQGGGSGGSGDYGRRGAEYGSTSGDYRRGPAPPRRSPSSGGYRTGTGSHRVVRDRRTGHKKLPFILAGVVGAVGVSVLAAFVVLGGVGSGDDDNAGQVGTATAGSSPTGKSERSIVPDACELLNKQVADKLAPRADRTQADNYQSSDRQNQCVWGAYTGDNKRQLTVELRAIEGAPNQTPTDVARGVFGNERKADESGKALLAGQELTEKAPLQGAGDEGYVVYSVDDGQGSGEAIANVRVVNVLVTVHYSGGNDGKPLDSAAAMGGATEAVKSVVGALSAS